MRRARHRHLRRKHRHGEQYRRRHHDGRYLGTHRAIFGDTVNVTANTGTIEATLAGSSTGISVVAAATVANGAGGTISGDGRFIVANVVNVTANAGTIKATGAGGVSSRRSSTPT